MSNELIPYRDMQEMAKTISQSGLFGIKRPEEALALMLVAQAEGRHPAIVARDYHIIQGRPALKADAMLARFQDAGGRIEWLQLDDTRAEAKFSHPQGCATISWDLARAKAAELGGRDMWRKYPRQMLRSRVISEGIRTVFPGAVCGVYEVEETRDMVQDEKPVQATVVVDAKPAPAAAPALTLDQMRAKTLAFCLDKALPVTQDEINAADSEEKLRELCRRKPAPKQQAPTTDFPGPAKNEEPVMDFTTKPRFAGSSIGSQNGSN